MTVDGNPLHEYDFPDDTEEHTTDESTIKYIEAQPGAEFAVCVKLDTMFEYSENDINLDVFVDGKDFLACDQLIDKAELTEGYTTTLRGPLLASGNNIIERNWVFSTLKTGQSSCHGMA